MFKNSEPGKEGHGKTMPPSRHEPTDHDETGSSTEKHGLGAGKIPAPPPPPRDVLIGPILFSVISFISLVFTVISIGLPWYSKQQYKPDGVHSEQYHFYLFKHVARVEGSPEVVTYPSSLCTPVQRRVRVMEAFSIVSSAMTLAMFVLSVMNAYKQAFAPSVVVRNVMLLFAAFAMVSLTIEVSFNFNVYLWSFAECGTGSSYHSQLYEPHVGFGLTVTAWVLTAFGGIIAANELTIPYDARTVDQSIHTFTLLSLVSFLFAVVSCPITHWFYKDGTTNTVTDVLLWRKRFGNFDWNTTSPGGHSSLFVKDYGCPSLTAYFRAAEAFSIASILFSMLAGVTGLLLWKSLAGTRLPALVFSYITAVMMVVQMALELKIYYGTWCGGAYAFHARYYVLSAGFGLVASSFCIMVLACIAVTVAYHLTERYFPAMIPRKTARQIAIEECQ